MSDTTVNLRERIINYITDEGEIFSYDAGARAADRILDAIREALLSERAVEAAAKHEYYADLFNEEYDCWEDIPETCSSRTEYMDEARGHLTVALEAVTKGGDHDDA